MEREYLHGTGAREGGAEARPQFNAVILYDGAEAGRRAMNQVRKVTEPLVADVELKVQLWRLDVLTEATTDATATATSDLATADLLLVAIREAAGLEANIRERLEAAVRLMRSPGAALAILANEGDATAPAWYDFLQQAAREAGVGFVFPPATNGPAGTHPAFAAIQGRATAITPTLAGMLKGVPARPRWERPA